ncbi:hypothetical protein EES43_17120 [Streptomyces sp. ADI96-02]|nr:hypothetical protein EES43_17120 [Streptomyces sp. ADI96-02]
MESGDATETVQGTARTGISLTKGFADTANGAYHHHNGEKPEAALLTRYMTTATLASLPLKKPYGGEFSTQNGGTVASLNHTVNLDGTPNVQTQLVNEEGTYVVVPNLAT